MSATCHPIERARGFTLLELLIVLAIIAGASALVAPRLQSTYDAIASSNERAEARRVLERLPLLAREAGHDLRFAASDAGAAELSAIVPLPAGWDVRPIDPVLVHASGMCEPARLEVARDGTRETWRLSTPLCTVDDGSQD